MDDTALKARLKFLNAKLLLQQKRDKKVWRDVKTHRDVNIERTLAEIKSIEDLERIT